MRLESSDPAVVLVDCRGNIAAPAVTEEEDVREVAFAGRAHKKLTHLAIRPVGIVGALGAIGILLALRKKPQPAAAPTPQPQLSPTITPGKANKTVAIEAAGDIAMGWVMGTTGKYKDQTFKLKDRTVIGTAADCDIVIEDGFMSGRHCEIRKVEGGFKMVDLGATNGVIVNDKRVKEHFLVDNDNFRLGRSEFKFKSIFS